MKRIRKIINEIDRSLRRIDIFLIVLKTLVILMVSYLLLFIIGVDAYYGFIPALIYFISSLFIEGRIDKIREVEGKYKNLNEKLRTARDYRDKDNVILDNLEEDIVSNLREVELSRFFPYSRMILLAFLLVFSVSASLYIASQDIKVIDVNDVINNAMKRFNTPENESLQTADFTAGKESFMQVGNERIQVEIKPVGMDIDFNKVTDTADYEFSTSFPKDVFISSGAAYENEYSEEQQVLIKKYFEKKKLG